MRCTVNAIKRNTRGKENVHNSEQEYIRIQTLNWKMTLNCNYIYSYRCVL